MEDDKRELPMPAENAPTVLGISTAVLTDGLSLLGVPGASTISKAVEAYANKKLEEAQNILFQRISEGEIHLLTDPRYENLIPNVLAYFEAAQRGEFCHNLKVLAHLLVNDSELVNSDAGLIKRASRRLEAMSVDDLQMLAKLKTIFDRKEAELQPRDGNYVFVEDRDIVAFEARKYVAPETEANSHLMDLTSRGLLFLGGNPKTIGGHYFYRTQAFFEIISAALAVS